MFPLPPPKKRRKRGRGGNDAKEKAERTARKHSTNAYPLCTQESLGADGRRRDETAERAGRKRERGVPDQHAALPPPAICLYLDYCMKPACTCLPSLLSVFTLPTVCARALHSMCLAYCLFGPCPRPVFTCYLSPHVTCLFLPRLLSRLFFSPYLLSRLFVFTLPAIYSRLLSLP